MKYWVDERSEIFLSKHIWDFSRPQGHNMDLDRILSVDAPVNEFPTITLRLTSTILEREVIASMRDHTMWAQGSRVEDPTKWEIPEHIMNLYPRDFRRLKQEMIDLKSTGVRQDEYRLLTPVLSYTSYAIKISLRSLVKLALHFEELGKDSLSNVSGIFRDSATDLWRMVNELTRHRVDELKAYRYIDLTPALGPLAMTTDRVGDFVVVGAYIPFSLRTHLIRHRSLFMKDDLKNFVADHGVGATLSDKIRVQAAGTDEAWTEVITKRSCWMAHYGMWSDIIRRVQGMFPTHLLPCNDGRCPFPADAELRYTDADPNPPCPIHAALHDIPVSERVMDQMAELVHNDNRGLFWTEQIQALEE